MLKKTILKIKSEAGFNFVEVLIALVIGAVVASGVAALLFQMADSSKDSSNHLIATKQIENAVYNISLDAAMNQEVIMTGSGIHFITFKWTDWASARYTLVSYSIDASGNLTRTQKIYRRKQIYQTGGAPESNVTDLVAKYIDPNSANTFCGELMAGVLTFQITCTVPGSHPATEVRNCQVTCRSR
jgi:prepilin-type N-terminal cleavage/methylation domain-containing protein